MASKNGECVLKPRSDNELLTKMLKGFLSSAQYAAQITALWHPGQTRHEFSQNQYLLPAQ